jgi:hypothetical protein
MALLSIPVNLVYLTGDRTPVVDGGVVTADDERNPGWTR